MDTQFVRDRITQLRLKKGVSEYQMSYDLGHTAAKPYLALEHAEVIKKYLHIK